MTFKRTFAVANVFSCISKYVDEVINRSITLSDARRLPSTYLEYFSRRSLAFGRGRVFRHFTRRSRSSRCSHLWLQVEQKFCQTLCFLRPKASALEGGTVDGLLSELT